MIVNDEAWTRVADLFAAAALDGEWPNALNALADASGAEIGELIGVGSDHAIPFNWMPRMDPAAHDEFVAIDGGNPLRNPRVRTGLNAPILVSWHDVQCSTDGELRRNFQYADFCRRRDIPYGSQATLVRDDGMLIGLATLRSERRGMPGAAERVAFEALVPQVRAAVRTQLSLEGKGADLVSGALDSLAIAAFVCDGAGLVRAHTRAAEDMLQRGVLHLRGRRLGCDEPAASRDLEAALAAAVSGVLRPGATSLRTLALRSARGERLEIVDVVRLPPRAYAFGFEPRALVVGRGVSRDPGQLSDVLGLAFGLTAAEADIALRLADGQSREAIAAARRASLATVRTQIKSLFAKVDVGREAELVARVHHFRFSNRAWGSSSV